MPSSRQRSDSESDRPNPTPGLLIPFALLVLLEGALAPIAVVLGYASGRNPLAAFGWTGHGVRDGLIATLPLIGLLGLAWRWPVGPLGRIKEYLVRELAPSLRDCRWPDLALLAVTAGVGEEMLFRGVLQGSLADWLGGPAGWLAASLLFGLFHPVSPAYVALAAVLGGYLGLVWLASGNLLAAMVAHAVYDFVALLALTASSRGREDP